MKAQSLSTTAARITIMLWPTLTDSRGHQRSWGNAKVKFLWDEGVPDIKNVESLKVNGAVVTDDEEK
ncbi:hypothetical protein E2C01_095407 [Portunus trituberculatus]|uniref:Uncharacterized protein n=1 Tax=Portunus trituberculatus TaxID=210409 RepID=A0A5B7JSY3_PORTR|nr:hypothetical protein [Portunus trituberculatus]